MKKYIYIAIAVFLIASVGYLYKMYRDLEEYKKLYNRELRNVEAYDRINSDLKEQLLQFSFTMDELRASKDSVNRKILAELDKLKIKDKNVQALQYNTSVIHKTDTVYLNDTVFNRHVDIDTVVGDEWYNMKLSLKYPSTIITEPTFKSEKYVIVNTKKEYNKTPSKIFFIRWFQKKHTVTEVQVIEKNPYIENTENKFIEVTK